MFGTNLVVGPQIKAQIRLLRQRVPADFLQRDMDDLGCGDGKITVLLKEVFQPRKLRGFDIHPALIRRARQKGIEAEIANLDEEMPRGELAVMWGVLHHLKNKEHCLRRISENYTLAFIREPVKNRAIKGLEMGQPLIKEEIEDLIKKYLPSAQYFYYGHCIFVFYRGSGKSTA